LYIALKWFLLSWFCFFTRDLIEKLLGWRGGLFFDGGATVYFPMCSLVISFLFNPHLPYLYYKCFTFFVYYLFCFFYLFLFESSFLGVLNGVWLSFLFSLFFLSFIISVILHICNALFSLFSCERYLFFSLRNSVQF